MENYSQFGQPLIIAIDAIIWLRLDANLKYEFDTFKASAEDYKPAPPKQDLPEYFL